MGVFVKICGLASESDVRDVVALGPDAVGFVFWDGSPRCVAPVDVARWTRDVPTAIKKVGVFVNADPATLLRTVETAGLDVVQLHGVESPAYCREIRIAVWKAFHLDRVDHAAVPGYDVDAFLVDSCSAASPGGTGITSDWQLARSFVETQSTRVILAGGLSPENVGAALEEVRPWGVDVSSGVESSPGRKDLARVKAFIEICREQ